MEYPHLKAFLDDASRPPDKLRYHEAQGFLFAVASAPELVLPSEWLPIVLAGLSDDRDTTETIADELLALYNDIVDGVTDGAPALPDDCQFREDLLTNLDEDAPVSVWSRGFAQGHRWLEESWEALAPDELDEDIGSALMVLSFFASPGIARGLMAEIGVSDLAETAAKMREMFPLAMADYASIGLEIDEASRTPVRVEKIGRNDPCPCGSGKKYKKCCGA